MPLGPAPTRHAAPVFTDDALRERLRTLATAAGLPTPPLEEDVARKPVLMAQIHGRGPAERIVVSPSLVEADAAEQTWHLAACLGWWASPLPRRRRRQGWTVEAILLIAQAAIGWAYLADAVDLPRGVQFAGVLLLGLLLLALRAVLSRREQRALDRAGHDVMAASGHAPATLARQAFGGRQDPPWFGRIFAQEPFPSQRIADADRWQVRPHSSLH